MSAFSDTATDTALPAFDPRAVARKAAVPAAVVALAAVAVVIAQGPLQAFGDALRRALDADPRWVALAAVSELASFGGYVALLWLIGGRATTRLGVRESTQVTLGGAAATRLLPTAGVGGAALTLWALRRTGMGSRRATQTLMTFLITLYSVFLVAIMVSGTALATGIVHGSGPSALGIVPAIGAAVIFFGHLALAARAPRENATGRVAGAAALIGAAVREGLAHVRSADPRLLGAVAWWTFDAAVLWAMLNAFGVPPSPAVLVLAYFVGQVGNTIPIPGAVSGGIVGILVAFAVPADLALVSVFAYRAVAIWLPAPIGLIALSGLRRTVDRWSSEDRVTPPVARPTVMTAKLAPVGPAVARVPIAPARVALPMRAHPEPSLAA
jgi:uncharacterized membrane protein YbhN (UPF0104 family)